MNELARAARDAADVLRSTPAEHRSEAIRAMARNVRQRAGDILAANAEDVAAATGMVDRLMLNEERLEGIAAALEQVAALPDPVGAVMERWTRPNGLDIAR